MFKIKRTVAVILILTAQLGAPLNALAADTSYIELFQKWNAAENAQVVYTYHEGYSGVLQFFYEDNCFYGHISYSETSMNNYENEVIVSVNVSNENRKYQVKFSSDSEDDNEFCIIYKNFTPDTKYGQDIYFIIEFNDKSDKNIVNIFNISVSVNSKSYAVGENISVGEKSEQTDDDTLQTTKNTTYKKKPDSDNAENETQTKFHYDEQQGEEAAEENNSDSYDSAQSSKFSSEGDYDFEDGYSENAYAADGSESMETGTFELNKVSELSSGAKAMLTGSAFIAAVGCAFICKALIGRAVEKEAQKIAAASVSEQNSNSREE